MEFSQKYAFALDEPIIEEKKAQVSKFFEDLLSSDSDSSASVEEAPLLQHSQPEAQETE